MALIRATSGSSGGGGMTITSYTSVSSGTYSCNMQNGVYYTTNTSYSSTNSYYRGYVENGVLHKAVDYSDGTSYSNGTLTINISSSVGTQDLYFFVVD